MKKTQIGIAFLCLVILGVGCSKSVSKGKLSLDSTSKAWMPADAETTVVYQDSANPSDKRNFVFQKSLDSYSSYDAGCERSFLTTTCYTYELETFALFGTDGDSLDINYSLVKQGDVVNAGGDLDVYYLTFTDNSSDKGAMLSTVVKGATFTPAEEGYTQIDNLTMQGKSYQNVKMVLDTLSNTKIYVTKDKGLIAYNKDGKTFVRQ